MSHKLLCLYKNNRPIQSSTWGDNVSDKLRIPLFHQKERDEYSKLCHILTSNFLSIKHKKKIVPLHQKHIIISLLFWIIKELLILLSHHESEYKHTCFKCEANKESAELFLPHTQITAPRIFLQKSVKFLAAKANFHINASSQTAWILQTQWRSTANNCYLTSLSFINRILFMDFLEKSFDMNVAKCQN